VRALGGAGVNALKTTANLAKGVESATALTAYGTKPLGWRPGRKRSGPSAPAAAADRPADTESTPPDQEEPMNDETSGNPKPQADQIRKASGLLKRASANPKSARHVKNIAKAAAAGHPGARLAQAAIVEARRQQPKAPGKAPLPAMPPLSAPVRPVRTAFSSWARGAA
jgi:hypothetical protein